MNIGVVDGECVVSGVIIKLVVVLSLDLNFLILWGFLLFFFGYVYIDFMWLFVNVNFLKFMYFDSCMVCILICRYNIY